MPEYLSPGVYVEEVSFRSKSIEGVATSTTGFAGMTRFGPVYYPEGPTTCEPRLNGSFTEFESVYGGLDMLHMPDEATERLSYTAHAARVFFLNAGRRLYIARVFTPRGPGDSGIASSAVAVLGATATWRARWPGKYGNVLVDTQVVRSKNAAVKAPQFGDIIQVMGARNGAVVEIVSAGTPPAGNAPLVIGTLAQISIDPADGRQIFNRAGGQILPAPTDVIQNVTLRVLVQADDGTQKVYEQLTADPVSKRYIGKILQADNPEDENAIVWLRWDPPGGVNDVAASLMVALQANPNKRLAGGNDGLVATPADLKGAEADPDDVSKKATGLAALGEVSDIAIVALPDSGAYDDVDSCAAAADALIAHAQALRFRIAVIDPPFNSSMTQVRNFRGRFDSTYAALYHPWLEILDPTQRSAQGAPPPRLQLPPSGFITGIYARTDVERGVFKAPANEPLFGIVKLENNITRTRQDVLNPEGINALRYFEGRGNRVWGARTISSDPEWMYVNVRRLFIYLEHSIDKGTQWAVFEPNNERLWANVRHTIEDFLLVQWRDGALLGSKPEEAYFVRCDRTTMTQNDLDNGRMICLIGVAPTKPAEYVIFRIGQWTADSKV
jgi:phage tail sheath protein FI